MTPGGPLRERLIPGGHFYSPNLPAIAAFRAPSCAVSLPSAQLLAR
jgi:hypothetical protein